ncbi:hypothetical protein EVAR_24320_1 [Eumeta japonica]|uniref:Protein ABHD18 n=1 Tax=Eumeta variegata TaxID=151549 RepID=A0A4C1VL18_EUMVA|nr:hypothetical protein EVAR_24320_1 [Eumeta japonica]
MSASKLDIVYRSILLTKVFTKGWGKPENLKRLFEFRKVVSNRDECFKLIERDYPVTITKEQNLTDFKLVEGYFTTPLERYIPGIVPEVAQKAYFQALFPITWADADARPVCLHLAGTGDHFFWRRRNLMVKPLLKEAGIGGIILENPFYGLRKPTDQIRSSLQNVSDIFVMGGCLILESLVLFQWCERNGLGPLGVTGLSMGGHMASLAATNWPKPLVLVPCLSWSTASAVFLQGVMAHSINWDLLEDQYLSDGVYREKLSKMVTIVDEAFLAGKKFARTFSEKINETSQETKADNISNQQTTANVDKSKDNLNVHPEVNRQNLNVLNTLNTKETKLNNVDTISIKDDIKCIKKEPSIETKIAKENNKIVHSAKNLETSTININLVRSDSEQEVENLHNELKKFLDENKISNTLYNKLISNKKFELDVEEIQELNKLNEGKDKMCTALQHKIEDIMKYDKCMAQNNVTKPVIDQNVTNEKGAILEKPSETEQSKSKHEKKSWNEMTSDIWNHLPFVRTKNMKKIDISKIHWRDREALQFMRGIMDECTHLSNFSVPYDTSLIIAVCAKHDAYVPREDVGALEEIWPGAEVRYVDAGHVSAYLLHQSLFRSCIIEAFERSKKKWKNGKHVV